MFNRTLMKGHAKSMLVFPLVHKSNLMGTLQIINKTNGECFNGMDEKNAFVIAEVLALSFYNQRRFVKPQPTKFGYLFEQGIVTKRELVDAITKARMTEVDVEMVLEKAGVRREDLGKSLEAFYNLPCQLFSESISIPELKNLDIESMRNSYWIPLSLEDSDALILINTPTNTPLVEEIQRAFTGKNVRFNVGLKNDILDFLNLALQNEYNGPIMDGDAFVDADEMATDAESPQCATTPDIPEIQPDIPEVNPDIPIETQVAIPIAVEPETNAMDPIKHFISEAHDQCVTKIHIEWGSDSHNLKVRFRKKGVCRQYEEVPKQIGQSVVSCLKKMANLDSAGNGLPQYGKTKLAIDSSSFELQIATFPTIDDHEDVVITILAAGKQKPKLVPLANINFSKANRDLVESAILKPNGLILVCGTEASGKTTLLHSLLHRINSPDKKILTVENPVEIRQEGLRQIQFDLSKGLTFAYALRAIMLGDPDIIMTGEIPDIETCHLALDAAQEHLVLGSTKNSTPYEAIKNLLAMGADPATMVKTGLMVIRQKFVEILCPDCKEEYHPQREEFDVLAEEFGSARFSKLNIQYNSNLMLSKPVGCKKCIYSGYKGRVGLQEILPGTAEIVSLAQRGADEDKIRETAVAVGMVTLKQDGILKTFQGVCDLKQVLETCRNSDS